MSQNQNRRPHELRVIGEKAELEVRIFALQQFFTSPLFAKVDPAEQERLLRQAKVMNEYFTILVERIEAFPPVPAVDVVNTITNVTDLNPDLAGQAIFKEAVPVGAEPIADINTFAMLIDNWHAQKIEHGNRMLQIPEGTTIEMEDVKNPGQLIEMDLNGPYLQVFRVGVLTVLHIFKDLPFGASIEEAEDGAVDAAG